MVNHANVTDYGTNSMCLYVRVQSLTRLLCPSQTDHQLLRMRWGCRSCYNCWKQFTFGNTQIYTIGSKYAIKICKRLSWYFGCFLQRKNSQVFLWLYVEVSQHPKGAAVGELRPWGPNWFLLNNLDIRLYVHRRTYRLIFSTPWEIFSFWNPMDPLIGSLQAPNMRM